MKDWTLAARGVVAGIAVTPLELPMELKDKGYCLVNREQMTKVIAHALEQANLARISELERQELTVSYGPAPGKPVLVSDKWLEDLNNKIAQVHQRLNHLDGADRDLLGRTVQLENVQRGIGDLITTWKAEMIDRGTWEARLKAVEKRADEHRRLIDNVDTAQLTLDRNLADFDKRLVAVEQSAFASRDYITRIEAGAKDTVAKFKAMRGET